ncbi:MAG: FlgD immunoglobulin-like domain containing protein [Armatimonadota bacterium]
MSVRLSRWVWTGMLSAMLLAFSGVAAFTQIAPLTISASPTSFNPSTGQTSTVIYNNSVKVYTMRVDVKNGSGSVVHNLASYDMIGTGPWNRVWDGKNSTGANVPAGSYSVVFTGKDSSGRTLAPATTTVTVTGTIAPPPLTTYAFRINSINPATVDPTLGKTTTITYTVPTTTDLRVLVKNSSGMEVRTLAQLSSVPAGTRTVTWDGKNGSGSVVPNGNYTVTVESLSATNITPASGTITVGASVVMPPVAGSLTISANPTSFDPTQGQTASVTYNNTVKVYTMRVDVKNSVGTVVRNIASYTMIGLGPWTKTWDGKNSTGTIVPAGTYLIVYSGNDSTGKALTAATATITVAAGTVTPPPTTYAFKISGITPSTIDMTLGQSTTVTYTVPTTTDVRVFVKNSAGTEVRTLATVTSAIAGTRTAMWDGKNSAGIMAANGNYTVTVVNPSTTPTVIAASGNITVTTSTVTPPPPPPPPSDGAEKGQFIEGAGSSNWDWTKRAGYKMGISFQSPKSGTLTQITLQWKKSSGYGSGTYGIYNFELQSNGAGNFPSGTIIAKTYNVNPNTAMDGIIDGAFHFPISASLTAGQIYHLVIYNVDSNPSTNFSSPNGLMTSVKPWDGTGNRTCYYSSGSWKPYGSTNSPWNTSGSNNVNCQYTATMLSWSDGTNTGYPYYSASLSSSAKIYGSSRAGEYILWDTPTTTISKVGVSVRKNGSTGALIYHLDTASGSSLATGTMNTSSMSGSYQNWVYATLPSAVTLTQGQAYKLWFESPSSTSSTGYSSNAVYGESRPATWSALSFGGARSYYIYGTSLSSTMPQADLSFSLQ